MERHRAKTAAAGFEVELFVRPDLKNVFVDDHHRAVQLWQGGDRYFEEVQRAVMMRPEARQDAQLIADDLFNLSHPLTGDVQVWRGVRSIERTFGVARDALETLVGRPGEVTTRFLSTTVYRQIAEREFTTPGRSPALMKVIARAGARAIWLPPLGDSGMAYQGELLFPPGVALRILSIDTMHRGSGGGGGGEPAVSRFWDDIDLVPAEDYAPTALQTLLWHLHLQDAPREQQESAIRDWLKDHPAEPGSMMEFSLRRNGFGSLLDGRATA